MNNTDPNYKATLVILNDIEKKGLCHFNHEYYDEKFFFNFADFEKIFSSSFSEIIRKLDDFTKRDEVIFFVMYSMLSYINSHTKIFEKFLKIIVDPVQLKGGFDENTTLSQMLKKTCNKMQYNPKLKTAIRGLFLADLADAIAYSQYIILKNGHLIIYPNDKTKKKQLTIDDLYDSSLQVRVIFAAMVDWADDADKPQENKTDEIAGIIKNLINQVNTLDEKLTQLS